MNFFGRRFDNAPRTTNVRGRAGGKTWYEHPERRVGSRLGHFRLKKLLGQGGYAVTYLAVDESASVQREVVIKILFIRPNEDALDKIRRFVLEASALDLLGNEPGFVVQVERGEKPAQRPEEIDHGKAEEVQKKMDLGRDYYLVLQYMSGGDLWQRIQSGRSLDANEAVRIIITVGRALSRAHQRGLLHRDVKPDNILFDSEGNPKVADLGLARFISKQAPQVGTAPINRAIGTAAYLPPESFYGRDTVQRDVYALGITQLELLTVPLPTLSSRDYADWEPIIEKALEQVQPPALRAIVQKAVAEKPAQRYQQVSDMTNALMVYLNNRGVSPPPSPPPIRDREPFSPSSQSAQDLLTSLLSSTKKARGVANQNWLALRDALGDLSLPQVDIPKKWPISASTVERLIMSGAIWATLNLVLTTFLHFEVLNGHISSKSYFYSEIFTFLLPIAIGILGFFKPWPASILAWGVLCLLLFALSPVAGIVALLAAAVVGYRLPAYAPAKRKDTLLLAWLILLTLPLIQRDIALAIPVAIGAYYGNVRRGAAAGALTYLLLSVWATLQGAHALGATMIFDPNGLGYPWYLDTTVSTFLNPREFSNFLRFMLSEWEYAWHFGELSTTLWTGSPAPLLSLFVWSGVGAVAARLGQTSWASVRYSKWPALLLSTLIFVALTWLLVILLGLQAFISLAHLLVAGLGSAIVAGILIALLKR